MRTLDGFKATLSDDGYIVVRLEHMADPVKASAEWLEARRRDMVDETGFQREYLLNWTSAEGDWFYPVVARAPDKYIDLETPFFPYLPVFRGWDFGFRHPSCVWSQLGPDGRLRVLRDIVPADIDTHSFRDLVLFLSGQDLVVGAPPEAQIEALQRRPRAIEELVALEREPPLFDGAAGVPNLRPYKIPFFPRGTRFLDFSGPEATKVQTFESEKGEKCDRDVLAAAGINLHMLWKPVSYGCRIIRRLLLAHRDGLGPGILFDARAENILNAFAGGLVWPKGTERQPEIDKDEPWKDGFFEHCHDALRYTVVNVIDSVEAIEAMQKPAKEPPGSNRFSDMPKNRQPQAATVAKGNQTLRALELTIDIWSPE